MSCAEPRMSAANFGSPSDWASGSSFSMACSTCRGDPVGRGEHVRRLLGRQELLSVERRRVGRPDRQLDHLVAEQALGDDVRHRVGS